MERDQKRMAFARKLKSGLLKLLVFAFVLALAVLAFAIVGSTR